MKWQTQKMRRALLMATSIWSFAFGFIICASRFHMWRFCYHLLTYQHVFVSHVSLLTWLELLDLWLVSIFCSRCDSFLYLLALGNIFREQLPPWLWPNLVTGILSKSIKNNLDTINWDLILADDTVFVHAQVCFKNGAK